MIFYSEINYLELFCAAKNSILHDHDLQHELISELIKKLINVGSQPAKFAQLTVKVNGPSKGGRAVDFDGQTSESGKLIKLEGQRSELGAADQTQRVPEEEKSKGSRKSGQNAGTPGSEYELR